jgi:hypothetical protein
LAFSSAYPSPPDDGVDFFMHVTALLEHCLESLHPGQRGSPRLRDRARSRWPTCGNPCPTDPENA